MTEQPQPHPQPDPPPPSQPQAPGHAQAPGQPQGPGQPQAQPYGQPQQGQPQPSYPAGYATPAKPMSQQDEKTWATLVHISPFAAAFVGLPFLGPLIVYLVLKDRGPFVRFHAAQALNFQIITTLALWVFGLLSFVIVGIPFLIATAIAWVVLPIVGAIKANNGEWYRYPLTPDWVK